MYKVKVWDDENMIFEGYTKKIPKTGEDYKTWTISKDKKNMTMKKTKMRGIGLNQIFLAL
jgi:hypothetical protein